VTEPLVYRGPSSENLNGTVERLGKLGLDERIIIKRTIIYSVLFNDAISSADYMMVCDKVLRKPFSVINVIRTWVRCLAVTELWNGLYTTQ
jgi:hypothetical protein